MPQTTPDTQTQTAPVHDVAPETLRLAYYRTVLSALRWLEAREPTGRRFGDDADVLWRTLATRRMSAVDRLELLIADADRQWRGAFGPRLVFELAAASEDEAFGATWERIAPAQVEQLWSEALAADPPRSPSDVARVWSQAWDRPLEPLTLSLAPSERITLAGASALAAALALFAQGPSLAWHRQVEVVATEPAERQLALLAAPLLAAEGATILVTAPAGRVIASADARPGDRQALDRRAPS